MDRPEAGYSASGKGYCMEKRTRRKHTPEFKAQAVMLATDLGSTNKAAVELGIHESLIRMWSKKFSGRGFAKSEIVSAQKFEEENRQLRKELAEQKKINHILKTAAAFFSQDHLK